jgi:surface protein
MSGMFWGCNSLKTINLSNFNTQSVKNMSWLFCECNSLIAVDLSKFRTQNVTNISGMFSSLFFEEKYTGFYESSVRKRKILLKNRKTCKNDCK